MKAPIKAYKYRILLISILLLLLTYPYFKSTYLEREGISLFYTLVLLAGVYAATMSRRTLIIGIILAIPTVIGKWDHFAYANNIHVTLIEKTFDIAFNVYIIVMIYFNVFQKQRITSDTIAGAVCIYFLMGIAWSDVYMITESASPGSLNIPETPDSKSQLLWTDILFFSFMTLTTTGYGDITPATMQMRSLAIIESSFGVLYLAIMIARLVSIYQEEED